MGSDKVRFAPVNTRLGNFEHQFQPFFWVVFVFVFPAGGLKCYQPTTEIMKLTLITCCFRRK